MSKHSSGTWHACKHGDYGDYDGECRVIVADDLRIVVVLGYDNEETDANTNLIAAAPDLLEALEDMTARFVRCCEYSGTVERKMLAKLQLRVGPFYCGKFEGILQLMGDGLKLISKEEKISDLELRRFISVGFNLIAGGLVKIE